MTLNITVLTEHKLYHSSDFRLSDPEGRALPVSAMKMISVDYPTFHGFVYYTGIARASGAEKDTGDQIEAWLAATPDMKIFQVVEHLRLSATRYVRAMPRASLITNRLTVVVAVFSRGRPLAAVISNFENASGIVTPLTLPEFQASFVAFRRGDSPKIIITGNKRAVEPAEKAFLAAEVSEASEDDRRIRTAIQGVNRRAAGQPAAKETISEECIVVSTDVTNRGSLEMGNAPALMMRRIRNGSDFSLSSMFSSLNIAGQLKSGTFVSHRSAPRRPSNCKKTVSDDQSSGYGLTAILDADGANCAVLGMSADGRVLGAHALPDDPLRNKFWTWSGGDELDYLDVVDSYSTCGCANEGGHFALVLGTQVEPQAIRYDSQRRAIGQLEIPSGMSGPNLTCMNSEGLIAGSIEVNKDVTDASRQKPAFWDSDGRITILFDLFDARSGQAMAINREGELLVFAHYDWFGVVGIVWNPRSRAARRLPGSVIPITWARNGEIVGFDRSNGRDAPALMMESGRWERVSVNNGFHPHTANSLGTLGGSVTIGGYETPWLLQPGGTPVLLTTYRYHAATMRLIGDDGTAVGTLSSNDEHHLVVWTPPHL